MAYWITFDDGSKSSVWQREDMLRVLNDGHEGRTVLTVEDLPYPASPRLDVEKSGMLEGCMPSFCMHPDSCKGRRSCPRNPSCTS